jgi:hypothetical protein
MCLLLVSVLVAGESEPPRFPQAIELQLQTPEQEEAETFTVRRNGIGLCEWGLLRIDLYEAALYLERPSRKAEEVIDSNQVKHLRLHFVRRLTEKQMHRAYRASFHVNAAKEREPYQERIDRFIQLIPAVDKGDTLTFTSFPERWLEIRRSDKLLGRIEGDDFARLFFRMYVGPHPPTEALRRGLLGIREED